MTDERTGPRQLSHTAKVVATIALGVWLVFLLVLRARHQARMRRHKD